MEDKQRECFLALPEGMRGGGGVCVCGGGGGEGVSPNSSHKASQVNAVNDNIAQR